MCSEKRTRLAPFSRLFSIHEGAGSKYKFNSLRFVAGLALLFAVCCAGSVTAEWTAYNDSIRAGGDGTAANVTSWTVHNGSDPLLSTGPLKDFATGLDTDVTVTFSMNTEGLRITSSGGDNPAPPTDAYASFYGIVNGGVKVSHLAEQNCTA